MTPAQITAMDTREGTKGSALCSPGSRSSKDFDSIIMREILKFKNPKWLKIWERA